MAIAQRPYPELLPRPAARPASRRLPAPRTHRAGNRVAIGPFLRPMLVASGLTVALVTYISGYAQMTGAGYQRVRLQAQQRGLRAEQKHDIERGNEKEELLDALAQLVLLPEWDGHGCTTSARSRRE